MKNNLVVVIADPPLREKQVLPLSFAKKSAAK